MLTNLRTTPLVVALATMLATASADAQVAHDHAMIVGSAECAECHKKENELWQASTHFKTFRNMPRSRDGRAIARKMGIRRIKGDTMCLDCHFTTQIETEAASAPWIRRFPAATSTSVHRGGSCRKGIAERRGFPLRSRG